MQRRINRVTGVNRMSTIRPRSANQLNALRDRMNREAGRNDYFVRRDLSGIGKYRANGQGGHGSP